MTVFGVGSKLITQAVRCDEWPDWLNLIVDKVNDSIDEGADLSTEQAIALGILLYKDSLSLMLDFRKTI